MGFFVFEDIVILGKTLPDVFEACCGSLREQLIFLNKTVSVSSEENENPTALSAYSWVKKIPFTSNHSQ